MLPNNKVKVMFVTTSDKVASDLANSLSSAYPDIPARFDICDTECAECLLNDDCTDSDLFNHDLYICFQEGNFLQNAQILKFVRELRRKSLNADIFVVSQGKDPFLFEELMKIGIEGVIDREYPNFSGVINAIRSLNEVYTKFSMMMRKLEGISTYNRACA